MLLAIAVGGIVAVATVPGESASKIAIALGVVAALLAAGNYATNPDWDDVSSDLRRLREIAEKRPAHVDSASSESAGRKWTEWLIVGAVVIWIFRGRRRRWGEKVSK
jgi:hypothetical protein